MNPFKNHDLKHFAAYVACALIVGGCALVAPMHDNATLILSIAAPLFLYAGISLPQGGLFSSVKDAAPKVGAVVFVLLGLGAVCATSQTACTPAEQQQVVNAIPAATACVLDVIGDATGAIDVPATAATCGATVEDIIAIVQALLANQPDAGAVADGAAGASPPSAYVARLHAWLDAAHKAKAAGAK